jgi:hypothetical protein
VCVDGYVGVWVCGCVGVGVFGGVGVWGCGVWVDVSVRECECVGVCVYLCLLSILFVPHLVKKANCGQLLYMQGDAL